MQTPDTPSIEIGRRWLVLPPAATPPSDSARIPLTIEPGKAFGAGDHPSTQLCLNALARHLKPGTPVIDLGTGTGILAIAAAKLGAGPILALDVDADSVRIARQNAMLNEVEDRMQIAEGSLSDLLEGRFVMREAPMVVANILSAVLVDFLDAGLTRTIADDGLLVLAGVLRAQTPGIRAALRRAALVEAALETMGDWACILARPA